MKDAPHSDETLEALLPEVREVAIGSATIRVRELTVEEMPRVLAQFKPLVVAMAGRESFDVTDLVSDLREPACVVAEVTTGIAAAKWRAAGAGKLLAVVKAAVQVNLDFFVRSLELGALLGAMMPTGAAGQTSSPTSPRADTPAP